MGTSLLKEYQMVTSCIDVKYINQNLMLVSISRNVKFGMVGALTNNKTPTLFHGLRQIVKIYKQFGFVVTTASMDGEFGHMKGDLAELGVTLMQHHEMSRWVR